MKWFRRFRARFRKPAPVLVVPHEPVYPDAALFMDGDEVAQLKGQSWPLKDKDGVAAARYFGCTFPDQRTRNVVVKLHQKLLTHAALKKTETKRVI